MSTILKRLRAVVITIIVVASTNYAISLTTSKSGVTTLPDFPKPKSGVTTLPDFPKPKSGVTTLPDFPKPKSGVTTLPDFPKP